MQPQNNDIIALKYLFLAKDFPDLMAKDSQTITQFFANRGKKSVEYHASLSSDHPDFSHPKPPNKLPTNDLYCFLSSSSLHLTRSLYTILMMEIFGYKSKMIMGESINEGINPYHASNMTEFLLGIERVPHKKFANNQPVYVRCDDNRVVITKPILLSQYLKAEGKNMMDFILAHFQEDNPHINMNELLEIASDEIKHIRNIESMSLNNASKILRNHGVMDDIFFLSSTRHQGEREITPVFANQQVSDNMTPDEYIKIIKEINEMPDEYFDMRDNNMKDVVKLFNIDTIHVLGKEVEKLKKVVDNDSGW